MKYALLAIAMAFLVTGCATTNEATREATKEPTKEATKEPTKEATKEANAAVELTPTVRKPMPVGITGEGGTVLVTEQMTVMLGMIDVDKAKQRLDENNKQTSAYRRNSYIASGATVTIGALVAHSASIATTGGILTAIVGTYSAYNENERKDEQRAKLVAACSDLIETRGNIAKHYVDWKLTFAQYGSNLVPDDKYEAFRKDTDDTFDKISGLTSVCI